VWIGWREQKQERLARPTTDEGMDAEASQQGKRMVSGSMSIGGIWVTPSPSQDGGTINDQITGSDEPSSQSLQNHQHKKGLMQRRSGGVATFAMLGRAQNTRLPFFIQRQATGQG
jgi:hypothetical protein